MQAVGAPEIAEVGALEIAEVGAWRLGGKPLAASRGEAAPGTSASGGIALVAWQGEAEEPLKPQEGYSQGAEALAAVLAMAALASEGSQTSLCIRPASGAAAQPGPRAGQGVWAERPAAQGRPAWAVRAPGLRVLPLEVYSPAS